MSGIDELMDEFWVDYQQCCTELRGVRTVNRVIEICKKYFGRSSDDAFFPGGSGDVELLTVLLDAGWRPVWIEASYFFAIREPKNVCNICSEQVEWATAQVHDYQVTTWRHANSDPFCGCGDGSMAAPSTRGLTYTEGDIARGIRKRI